MKTFVIVDTRRASATAFAKVANDITDVLCHRGARKICLNHWSLPIRGTMRILGMLWGIFAWCRVRRIERGSVVVVQYPFAAFRCQRFGLSVFGWLKEKNCRVILFVHDVDVPRFVNDGHVAVGSEFVLTLGRLVDRIVVHGPAMRKWFEARDFDSKKLVELGVFDYLATPALRQASFSRDVIVAGNLHPKKAGYASRLHEISDVNWVVYSGYWDEKKMGGSNIRYMGTCPSELFPGKLTSGFGLVWDGDGIDTATGNAGEYMRLVSPHKLSLFLTSGLPVIVWKYAAVADFIRENDCGVLIESLRDLPHVLLEIDADRYAVLSRNAMNIASQMRAGYFTLRAFEQCVQELCNG